MIDRDEKKTNNQAKLMGKHITEPNEPSQSRLIRHDLDYNPDLEEFLINEEIDRILAITFLICTALFLINTFFW